ncbi:polyamine aminopropyltransferase [Marinicella meishanensis]|uniref:polyamine aminopropyltransferase n=1 Tax=Marinicella meishanensis TaxID=2873263 RepID=UPI001CBEB289
MSQAITETLYTQWGQTFTVDRVLFEHQTAHQHLVIFENQQWGTVMVLDGVVQTTERDEFIYHEMMTHVPLLSHPKPQKVLIVGGGDGGILREVLKHPGIETVTQVEIDQAVIDMCRQHLPNHSQGAFADPRVKVVIGDGVDFVAECTEQFDVIISDSTDPIGPGESLFTSRFYQGVAKCLTEDGIFVAQNGVSFMQLDEVTTTHRRLTPHFQDVTFYSAAVPTYVGGIMTFAWAAHNPALRQAELDPQRLHTLTTRYHNAGIHRAAFALPQYILDQLEVDS